MTQSALHKYWHIANLKMVAKLISEFGYEQAFSIHRVEQGFVLELDNGTTYQFDGKENIWGQIVIEPQSLVRTSLNDEQEPLSAALFTRDIQALLEMPDEAMAEHLEDLNATLWSDCQLMARKASITAKDLSLMSCEEQQSYFDGHPKFAFNKGRRGWGSEDLLRYAPESHQAFQLGWVAVHNDILQVSTNQEVNWGQLVESAVNKAEIDQMQTVISGLDQDVADYHFVPVHPWQWHNKLALLFTREQACKQLIYLGEFGDLFLPQLSLRTLSNATRPQNFDIKLPLTVMNTSCYRGIPGRYILAGPTASDWIHSVFQSDPILLEKQAEVLQEPAAAFAAQHDYAQLQHAPYRYHELLGVIWRESAISKLKHGESAILMAALMETDCHGTSLISEYIHASGVSTESWLGQLFDAVVIPYYHLLCKYGVSLIAHGQNVTLVMEDSLPKRILLKDFQGDMRLVDKHYPEQDSLSDSVKEVTVRLPEELIIHDLQTGHFVTVLRFISPLVEQIGVSEETFYQILGNRIRSYAEALPELEERFRSFDLFKPRILRIGLNLAKFRHNTDSSSSRMLPDMDEQLDNPLHLSANKEVATELQ
ncbi:IucA/IucC family protein [Vibrio coralliilyticus]|uniref:IucA/IucC family protein n=1 Tax=Vibrio coralliilyticus TaxID=190893 RepID=UPI003916E22A